MEVVNKLTDEEADSQYEKLPELPEGGKQFADAVIIVCDNRERENIAGELIAQITETHIRTWGGDQRVFLVYQEVLEDAKQNEIKGLPKGFKLSYNTMLPNNDYLFIICKKKINPETKELEWDFIWTDAIERKSWPDWYTCVSGQRVHDFQRQVLSMESPFVKNKVYKHLVLTGAPDLCTIDKYSADFCAMVTKQQKLIREYSYEFKMCFNEHGFINMVRGLLDWYLEGHFSKKAKKHGVNPEVLANLGREKVSKPIDALRISLSAFTGIGEQIALGLSNEIKTVRNLSNILYENGPLSLSDFLINNRRLGDEKSKIIYNGIIGDDPDNLFVDQEEFAIRTKTKAPKRKAQKDPKDTKEPKKPRKNNKKEKEKEKEESEIEEEPKKRERTPPEDEEDNEDSFEMFRRKKKPKLVFDFEDDDD